MSEKVKVKCISCGKELEVPKAVKDAPVVCNPTCYSSYILTLQNSIYEVEFCESTKWSCLDNEFQIKKKE